MAQKYNPELLMCKNKIIRTIMALVENIQDHQKCSEASLITRTINCAIQAGRPLFDKNKNKTLSCSMATPFQH